MKYGKLYQSIHNPEFLIRAIHYSPPDVGVTEIVTFVLDLNVDRQLTIDNERILDVVRPVYSSHPYPSFSIAQPPPQGSFLIAPYEWLVRDNGRLRVIKDLYFNENYMEVSPELPKTEFDELYDLIYDTLLPLEGEVYQTLAQNLASEIIRAGWFKKE